MSSPVVCRDQCQRLVVCDDVLEPALQSDADLEERFQLRPRDVSVVLLVGLEHSAVDVGLLGELRLRQAAILSQRLQAFPGGDRFHVERLPLLFRVSLLYNICCIKSRGETKRKPQRSGCAAFDLSEQVVDGHADGVGEVLELIVGDNAVAGLDPADGLLRDVEPRDLDLAGESAPERGPPALWPRGRARPDVVPLPKGLYLHA